MSTNATEFARLLEMLGLQASEANANDLIDHIATAVFENRVGKEECERVWRSNVRSAERVRNYQRSDARAAIRAVIGIMESPH